MFRSIINVCLWFISNWVYMINKKNNVNSTSFPLTHSWGGLGGNWGQLIYHCSSLKEYPYHRMIAISKACHFILNKDSFLSSRRNVLLWGVFTQSNLIVYVQVCLESKENPCHIYTTHYWWRGFSSPSLVFFRKLNDDMHGWPTYK